MHSPRTGAWLSPDTFNYTTPPFPPNKPNDAHQGEKGSTLVCQRQTACALLRGRELLLARQRVKWDSRAAVMRLTQRDGGRVRWRDLVVWGL